MDLRQHNDDARAIIRTAIADGRPQDLRFIARILQCAPTAHQIRDAYEAFDFLTPELWSWLKGRRVDQHECFGMRQIAETVDGQEVTGTIVDFKENGVVILEDDDGMRWHGYMGGYVAPIDQPEPIKPPRGWRTAEPHSMPHWYDKVREHLGPGPDPRHS